MTREMFNEKMEETAAVITAFRAVRMETTQVQQLQMTQWTAMKFVDLRPIYYENSKHHVLIAGGKYSSYAGGRHVPPTGLNALGAALIGELAAFLLYGDVTLDAVAAAATNPNVVVSARRRQLTVDTAGEQHIHSVHLRCPNLKTISGLIEAAQGVPVTLYLPRRIKPKQAEAIDALPCRHLFTITRWSAFAWPPA